MPAPVLAPGARLATENPSEASSPELRISDLSAAGMLAYAFVLDGFQLLTEPLLLVPFLFSIIAFVSFGIWFMLKKVNYLTGRQSALKLIAVFGTLVIDLMPLINALPDITMGVLTMIVATRIEDTVGKKKVLQKRLKARKFWQGVTNNSVVNGLTGGAAEKFRAAQEMKARNQMAAQYSYGRKDVTKKEAESGIESLRGQMQAIASEAPGATKERPSERGSFDSQKEDQRRRYERAREYRRLLEERRRLIEEGGEEDLPG